MDVIGTITSVIELFSVAKGLFDRYQDAPRAVLELKSDCEWTRRLCCGLKDEILKDPDILQDGVTDDPLMWCFRRAMRDITNTIRKIERELDKVDSRRISRQNTSMGRRDRARFIWREDQFRDASQNVRNQRDMISSTIAGLQLRQSQKVLTLMRSVQPPAPTPTHYIEPEPVPTHLVDPDIPQSVLAEIISNLIPQPNLGLGDAGVEERDESFAADLHNAVNSGQVANLHAVLARNGPIDTKLNADGDRALHIAARNGYSLILGRLLAAGADVDVQNDALCTPLISALSRRQIEAAMTLLFEDADWKHENANDLTALHLAARGSIRLVIEYLLEKGADPNLQDDQGQTPLFLACRPSDEDGNLLPMDGEIIRLLIHHGADPTITTRGVGFTPMHILARDGYAKELELVATVTASYDIRAGGMYYTPLELAITSSHLDVVESLIKLKANVNTRRVTGDSVQTPLWYATLCNNPEITTKLLEASADPNVKLRDGMTVLHFATEKKRADIVKTLVTDSDFDRMSPGSSSDGFLHGHSRYQGEDTRPTSQKELSGWYAYAFAAETYVICAIGSFIPILLETLARENGVLLSDRTTPCGTSDSKNKADGQCTVYVLGMEINTASFAMYTFSISVLVQALLVVSISSAADHGDSRKKLLLTFAWVGSFSVMAYIFVSKSTYLLGALLAIISNASFGASFVLLNSFLPLLVRYHPEVLASETVHTPDLAHSDMESQPMNGTPIDEDSAVGDMEDSTSALLGENAPLGHTLVRKATHEEITSVELQLSTQISSKGIGTGYIAGLFVQCAAIAILIAMKNSTWSQRVVLFVVGAWWTLFTIPAAMWLRPRPGPPMPVQSGKGRGVRAWLSYTKNAWKSLFRTVKVARRLRDIMLYLCAWFFLSDSVATTSSTAILFAKTQLHMKPWALGMINVISTTFGVIGAFGWAFVSHKLNLRPHQTILVCILLFELIPIYGLLGYLPFVRNWGVGGLQQPWEMYPLAAVYGLVLAGISSFCRSLYGELIPPGSEAAFYALYAITDKGSSVFGPAIVGAIIDKSGDIRPAFWFLAALVAIPAPLIWSVNVERGKREGEKLAETIEGFESQRQEKKTTMDMTGPGDEGIWAQLHSMAFKELRY
ncbi:autophagy protein atg22 [Colletotrichum karsti]|uniref:Autophagy protein atg22 n=1 Tax=Colletotrichum karsti TaxID=1095194 RepID=A0A9P6IBU7_9PEZI|nr:autophagy protein atg22 [Colletotrichum karsti]KAF9879770.1 autophagy protein atg22 [Colletotrichum karsti]